MSNYDVPQERRGVLGDMALPDSIDQSLAINRKKALSLRSELAASFNDMKAARMSISCALVARGKQRTQLLAAVVVPDAPRGLGKLFKAADTELRGMIQESTNDPHSKINAEKFFTQALQGIKYAHSKATAKLKEIDGAVRDVLSEEARESLEVYNKEAAKIRIPPGKKFVVLRAPVIPIGRGFFDTATAKTGGLSAKNVGGYMLLEKQMVIGLAPGSGKAVDELAEIIKSLTSVTHKKMLLVTNVATRYKGNLWYWVADQRTLSVLAKANRGPTGIVEWGFGFTSE